MPLDPMRRMIPGDDDPADWPDHLAAYSLTDTGLPVVSSQADAEAFRAAYNTAIQQRGGSRGPVLVYRSDLRQIHLNHNDGSSAWEYMAGRQHGATVNMSRSAVDNGAVRNVTVSGFARLSPGWTVSSNGAGVIAPATGMYLMTYRGSFSGTASNLGRVFVELISDDGYMIMRGGSTNESVVGVTAVWPLSAGDYIGVNCYHETGGPQTHSGQLQITMATAPAW